MNFRSKNGSLVIMVLILMTALVAIVYSMLRATSYLVLLAREREIYEQQYHINTKNS